MSNVVSDVTDLLADLPHFAKGAVSAAYRALLAGLLAYAAWWFAADMHVVQLLFGDAHYWDAVRLVLGGMVTLALYGQVRDRETDMHQLGHLGVLVALMWMTAWLPSMLYGIVS